MRGCAAHVIHVASPDLRQLFSREDAEAVLVVAYMNVLRQFLRSDQKVLRLLPISGRIFAGPLRNDIPTVTKVALRQALRASRPASAAAS